MLHQSQLNMGTVIKITIEDDQIGKSQKIMHLAFKEIERIVKLMSIYEPTSEVSILNRTGSYKNANPDLVKVIRKAQDYYQITEGAFDITVLPVLRLWRNSWQTKKLPKDAGVLKASALSDSNGIIVENGTIRFQKPGMGIDLGGIAKGYAIDSAITVLRKNGISRALVNAGGDIKAIGSKSDTDAWRIGIRDPLHKRRVIRVIQVTDHSVATSGTYNRCFDDIINPGNGLPADTVLSATAIAKDAIDADVLSTSLYILGANKGMELIERLDSVEALIFTKNGESRESSGWRKLSS